MEQKDINRIALVAFVFALIGISQAGMISTILSNYTCTNCIIDNPTFINYSVDINDSNKVNKSGDTMTGDLRARNISTTRISSNDHPYLTYNLTLDHKGIRGNMNWTVFEYEYPIFDFSTSGLDMYNRNISNCGNCFNKSGDTMAGSLNMGLNGITLSNSSGILSNITESDPGDHISLSDRTITLTGLARNENAYAYLQGNVDNWIETGDITVSSSTGCNAISPYGFWISGSNLVQGISSMDSNNGTEAFVLMSCPSTPTIFVRGSKSGVLGQGASIALNLNTKYYYTYTFIKGTNASLDVYSDAARTTRVGVRSNLSSTNTMNVNTTYFYGANTYNDGTASSMSGAVNNISIYNYNTGINIYNWNATTTTSIVSYCMKVYANGTLYTTPGVC